MSFKFNGGAGAVVCDGCRVMIDEGIGHDEYARTYQATKKKDLCWRCKSGKTRRRQRKAV